MRWKTNPPGNRYKKALCHRTQVPMTKGFFVCSRRYAVFYFTSSMTAVSAASPRRMPVRVMRV